MPKKKIAAANTDSLEVAQETKSTMPTYYEYFTTYGMSVLLDRYE